MKVSFTYTISCQYSRDLMKHTTPPPPHTFIYKYINIYIYIYIYMYICIYIYVCVCVYSISRNQSIMGRAAKTCSFTITANNLLVLRGIGGLPRYELRLSFHKGFHTKYGIFPHHSSSYLCTEFVFYSTVVIWTEK
jgi:hypothetical protein